MRFWVALLAALALGACGGVDRYALSFGPPTKVASMPAAGRVGRGWVIEDNKVARGWEKNGAKRRRFATSLPKDADPTGLALVDDELLVCDRHHDGVFRLHIGLDVVARRRGYVKGLRCETAIAATADGTVFTRVGGEILRYRPS